MNQYPAGLVPMMVPQPYMMAVRLPPGMQPQSGQTALGPAALSQTAIGQAALGQAAIVSQSALGQSALSQAAVMTQAAIGQTTAMSPALVAQTAIGQTAAIRQSALGQTALAQNALGQTALGQTALGQTAYGQAAALTSATLGHSAFLPSLSGLPLAAQRFATPPPGGIQALSLASAAAQGLSPSPQMLQIDPNALKLAYAADGGRASIASMYGMGDVLQPAEPVEKAVVTLDEYNSDLHLVLDEDGYGAHPLNEPPGFCFCWAGVKASHGVYRGKAYFEMQVTEHQQTDFGTDHQEKDPHILRIGWSLEECTLQLGEEQYSYGYGGTGKFSQNVKFTNYGEKFGHGDVIGALLDLDSQPPTISYMKNGQWLGVAHTLHGFTAGIKEKALFPHILTKNSRFRLNLGQEGTWYPPPQGYNYVQQIPDKVKSMDAPEKKSDCEMIMIIGLPGAGKTTFGINMQKTYPEKRYNIIGTDTLIDKMKVMGLPRKNNYHGRWEVLIDKATKALNKLFEIAKNKPRNYILDQTNVYPSARKRKMKNFTGFFRRAMIIQPDDAELNRRSEKRTVEDGKFVPESAVLEMKANFKLPDDNDPLFDSIEYVELQKKDVQELIDRYNVEGGPRQQQNRFGQKPFQPPADMRQAGSYSNPASNAPPLPSSQYGERFQQTAFNQGQVQDFGQQGRARDDQLYDRQNRHGAKQGEPPEKRGRFDNSGNSSALDLLKQEYEDEESLQPQMAPLVQARADLGRQFGFEAQQLNSQSLLGLPPGHLLAGQPMAFGGSNLQIIGHPGLAAERTLIPGYGQPFGQTVAPQHAQADLVKTLQERRSAIETVKQEIPDRFTQQNLGSQSQSDTNRNSQNRPNSRGGFNDQQNRNRPNSNSGQGYGRPPSNSGQYSQNQNQQESRNRQGGSDQRDNFGRGNDRSGINQDSSSGGHYGSSQGDSNQSNSSQQYGNIDYGKSPDLNSSQNDDKPRRERKRPSKWDNPDVDTTAAAAAESGVSQEVMAKVQAIQQSIQRQHEQQEQQSTDAPPAESTPQPQDQTNKSERWSGNQDKNQFGGNFAGPGGPPGPRPDGFPPRGFGGPGRPPRPMMGRGGPPGQRPPFRPPGPMGDRFPGPPCPPPGPRPDGFPPRPDGFGGPGPRFGGRGPPPGDQRFGGPGRGGPPGPFRPRGPGDQGGMRGGRPPFAGRGPPGPPGPFGARGGMQRPPRGGGRWPRPN